MPTDAVRAGFIVALGFVTMGVVGIPIVKWSLLGAAARQVCRTLASLDQKRAVAQPFAVSLAIEVSAMEVVRHPCGMTRSEFASFPHC